MAVDARTGEKLWQVRLGDYTKGETLTMAPLVVKDKVLIGNSGGEFGARGRLVALDAVGRAPSDGAPFPRDRTPMC